jgi:signal transduction histidine kinase
VPNPRLVLDLVPPTALALVTLGLGSALWPRRAALQRPHLALACLAGPLLYALGTATFLLGESWIPGAALSTVGVLTVVVGLVASLHRERPLIGWGAAALAVVTWGLAWASEWSPESARVYEPYRLLILSVFLTLALVLIGVALRLGVIGPSSGPARRVAAAAAPLLGAAAAVGGLQAGGIIPRGPAVPALALVSSQLVLYLLIKESRVDSAEATGWLRQALVLPLVGVGAVVAFGLAANLRLLPRAPGALLVSAGIATVLALAYGAFLPGLEALIRRALYPEAQEAEERAAALAVALEEARERLRRAEQRMLVGELAAQVAHEIKNPLGPIKGYAAVIQREAEREGALTEKLARGLEVIRAEVDVIDSRAKALLDLAREERASPNAVSLVDVTQLVDDCLRALAGEAPEVATAWSQRPEGPLTLRCDALLLRSAVGNLLQNAAQVGAGRIEVDLEPAQDPDQGPVWRLALRDDGPGLPAPAGELLRPFVTYRPSGTGLGLAIARGAARSLGGSLDLATRPEGGAVATLLLPRSEAPDSEPDSSPAGGVDENGATPKASGEGAA